MQARGTKSGSRDTATVCSPRQRAPHEHQVVRCSLQERSKHLVSRSDSHKLEPHGTTTKVGQSERQHIIREPT
eukprot:4050993-Amphidinium_carterae.1